MKSKGITCEATLFDGSLSRTDRTYPDKTKGLIVTFRKPATMEKNVEDATKLYSEAKEESGLIYP
ncbi:hypothetical protein, partial [Enterococcus faecium]|uniref:hypothetical protein n=1 Tax=Enterococcus faecium TaxID=1352 RepID=UPI003CC7497F